jgi:hypothetical protein
VFHEVERLTSFRDSMAANRIIIGGVVLLVLVARLFRERNANYYEHGFSSVGS